MHARMGISVGSQEPTSALDVPAQILDADPVEDAFFEIVCTLATGNMGKSQCQVSYGRIAIPNASYDLLARNRFVTPSWSTPV